MSPLCLVLVLFTFLQCGTCDVSENPYSFHLFENFEGNLRTFKSELQLMKSLQEYKMKLLKIKEKIKEMKFQKLKYHRAPVESFKFLMKHFAFKREFVKNINQVKKMENDFTENQINTTLTDYHGALNGLVLLQDTYDFRQVLKDIQISTLFL